MNNEKINFGTAILLRVESRSQQDIPPDICLQKDLDYVQALLSAKLKEKQRMQICTIMSRIMHYCIGKIGKIYHSTTTIFTPILRFITGWARRTISDNITFRDPFGRLSYRRLHGTYIDKNYEDITLCMYHRNLLMSAH